MVNTENQIGRPTFIDVLNLLTIQGVAKTEAEEMKKTLEAAGAKVELK